MKIHSLLKSYLFTMLSSLAIELSLKFYREWTLKFTHSSRDYYMVFFELRSLLFSIFVQIFSPCSISKQVLKSILQVLVKDTSQRVFDLFHNEVLPICSRLSIYKHSLLSKTKQLSTMSRDKRSWQALSCASVHFTKRLNYAMSLLINLKIQMISESVDSHFQDSIRQIYDILAKLQFPPLLRIDDSDSEDDKPLNFGTINLRIGKYLHGSESRLHLLEWLISKFDSNLLPRQKCTKQERIKNIKAAFSHLGLLPISKHSKNLDYQKYVEGLLSLQSSISSILKLALFVRQLVQNRKREKSDNKFSGFLRELVQNKTCLVNRTYDPFPLTLPPQFSNLSEAEFDVLYQSMIKQFSKAQEIDYERPKNQEFFMESSAQTKLRYKTTLAQLSHVINQYSRKQVTPPTKETEQSRLINIDGEFLKVLRNFNKMITIQPQNKTLFTELMSRIKTAVDNL